MKPLLSGMPEPETPVYQASTMDWTLEQRRAWLVRRDAEAAARIRSGNLQKDSDVDAPGLDRACELDGVY